MADNDKSRPDADTAHMIIILKAYLLFILELMSEVVCSRNSMLSALSRADMPP